MIFGLLLNWLCECIAFSFVSDKGIYSQSSIKVMAWNIDGSQYDSLKVSDIATVIHKHNPGDHDALVAEFIFKGNN